MGCKGVPEVGDKLASGTCTSIPLLPGPDPAPGSTDGTDTATSGLKNEGTYIIISCQKDD